MIWGSPKVFAAGADIDDEVYDEAVKLAARYAASPAAITLAKQTINNPSPAGAPHP